jgi:peroxiredoxin
MSRFIGLVVLAGFSGLLTSCAPRASIRPGASAPTFEAQACQNGDVKPVSLQDSLKSGPLVLYFFPSAFTKGCDLEAHAFAEKQAEFTALGANIMGISADSVERLKDFSKDPDYCAGRFPVVSDSDGKIAAAYGLTMKPGSPGHKDVRGVEIGHGFIPRTTFVIDRGGRILASFSSEAEHLEPAQHVERALAALQGKSQ